MMCVHDEKDDSQGISRHVRKYGRYEENISQILKKLLHMMTKLHEGSKKTIFLDVGANIGMHTLYVAKLGYPVWAVEPQKKNIIKVNSDIYIYIYIYMTTDSG